MNWNLCHPWVGLLLDLPVIVTLDTRILTIWEVLRGSQLRIFSPRSYPAGVRLFTLFVQSDRLFPLPYT